MSDVICPAGKGTLSMKECMDCALTWENPCLYDYGILRAMFNKPEREGIHVTDLTGCLRKAYYGKTMPRPMPVHNMLTLYMGTAIHADLERSGDAFSRSEVSLFHDGVIGMADRVYNDGILVDYKTTRWMVPSRLPYGSHELQVQIYADMLENMGRPVSRAFIQYVDVSGPTKCTAGARWAKCNATVILQDGQYVCPKCGKDFPEGHLGAWRVEVDITRDISSMIKKSRDALLSSLESGIPPYPEVGWLCGYCQYTDVCDAVE